MKKEIYSESIFVDSGPPPKSKPIPGYGGFYRADVFGQIWTCRIQAPRGKGKGRGTASGVGPWRMLTGCDANGYLQVGIRTTDGRHQTRFVHRLVLETFVGPRPPGKQTRHLDSNKRNNRRSNLKWGTAKENDNDKLLVGTHGRGEKNGMAKLNWGQVREIRKLYTNPEITRRRRDKGLHTYQSLGILFEVDLTQISNIVKKLEWAE